MSILDELKKALARTPSPSEASPSRRAQPDLESRVPEVTAAELQAELENGSDQKPLLLDCREDYERRQSFIPDSLHIPMNAIPQRLDDLDRGREVVVYCAHGNRSYSVAGWLIQQGLTARSLKGGIVDWQARGGATEGMYTRR